MGLFMFSSTAEYALRAVVHLATRPTEASTVQQIAQATKVPAGYLAKVLQDLARAGVVSGQRGPNGGFVLNGPVSRLTMLEVINAVDPINRITRCPLDIPAHSPKLCKLHQQLDDAIASVQAALGNARIADMIEPVVERRGCGFPIAISAKPKASGP